jgi:hypothetical protein
MSASSMGSVSEAEFPAKGTPRQQLGYALKYAMLAPTEMNWQPWEFRVTDEHIELVARNEPVWEAIDPDGRELMISCGAALLFLKLALKHFGCLGQVELFPDLDQPALAARIHHGISRKRDAQEKLLFEAMSRRRTTSPTGEVPISESALAVLNNSVAGERGWVEFAQSEISRQRLLELVFAGERQQAGAGGFRSHPAFPAEHRGATVRSEGATVAMTGRRAARWTSPLLAFTVRRTHSRTVAIQPEHEPTLPTATLAVVKTKTDDKHGWLAAGHAMARVILQAQVLGLSWSFFNQAVRRRDAREALRTGIGHKGFAQVILRFGLLMPGAAARPSISQTMAATAS